MKFVVVLACLLAVVYVSAAPAEDSSQPTVEDALHKVLIEAGVDPDVASGWISNFTKKVVSGVKKVVPYVQAGMKVYGALGG